MTADRPVFITLRPRLEMQQQFAEIQREARETQAEAGYDLGMDGFLGDCLRIAGKTTTVDRLTQFVRRRAYRLAAPYEQSLAAARFISGENPLEKVADEMGIQIPDGANLVEGLTQVTIGGLVQNRPFVEALVGDPEHVKLVKNSLSQPIPAGTFPSSLNQTN